MVCAVLQPVHPSEGSGVQEMLIGKCRLFLGMASASALLTVELFPQFTQKKNVLKYFFCVP